MRKFLYGQENTTPSCGHPSLKKGGEGKLERVLTIKKENNRKRNSRQEQGK